MRCTPMCSIVTFLLAGACTADQVNSYQTQIANGSLDSGHSGTGALFRTNLLGKTFICSCSLVGQKTVLTAAHCVAHDPPSLVGLSGVDYTIESIVAHSGYRDMAATDPQSTWYANDDIALIRLRQVPPTSIARVRVSTHAPSRGDSLTLVGLGDTAYLANSVGVKYMATTAIDAVATQYYSYSPTASNPVNVCPGDSGGPSFVWQSGQEVQAGVHAFISGPASAPNTCGTEGHDLRVDYYTAWLQQNGQGDVLFDTGGGSASPVYDTLPPNVYFDSPIGGTTLSARSQPVVITALDNVGIANISLRVDGRVVSSVSQSPLVTTIQLTPGSHTLQATATDTAGNLGQATINVTAGNTDSDPPTVTFVAPSSTTISGPVQVRVAAQDTFGIASVTLSVDGRQVAQTQSYQLTKTLDLAAGQHVLEAVATDPSGNQGRASVSVIVTGNQPPTNQNPPTGPSSGSSGQDTTPPQITLIEPAFGNQVPEAVFVRARISDDRAVASAWITVDGKHYGTVSAAPYDFPLTLSAGAHAVMVYARDSAGNVASLPLNLVVVPRDPAATGCSVSGGGLVGGLWPALLLFVLGIVRRKACPSLDD